MFSKLLILLASTVGGVSALPDSTLTQKSIEALAIQDPEEALLRIDEGERRQLYTTWEATAQRAVVYSQTDRPALQLDCLRKVLSNDSVRHDPERRLKYLTQILTALEGTGRLAETIDSCKSAITVAQEAHALPRDKARIYSVMASLMVKLDRNAEALAAYGQAERLLEKADNVRDMAELSTIYGQEMSALYEYGDIEGMLDVAQKREILINRMAPMPGPPAGYIDQQRCFLYSKWALALEKAGRPREAADRYAKYKATRMSESGPGASFGVPYLLAARRYAEALRLNDIHSKWFLDDSGIDDTVHYEWLMNLQNRADALSGLGRASEADATRKRAYTLQDSLYARERLSQAAEKAALFELEDKELKRLEAQREASSARRTLTFVTVVALVAVMTLLLALSHYRKVIRRRKLIVEETERHIRQKRQGGPIAPVEEKSSPSREAYNRILEVLYKDNLLADPTLSRDKLLAAAGISRNNLGGILRENSDASSFSDFISRLRCERAIELMSEKPNYSMQAIGTEAGFGSRATFYRAFQNIYKMTPTQYMEILRQPSGTPAG